MEGGALRRLHVRYVTTSGISIHRCGLAELGPPRFRQAFGTAFAHVSFNVIVRLNTKFPGFESGSRAK